MRSSGLLGLARRYPLTTILAVVLVGGTVLAWSIGGGPSATLRSVFLPRSVLSLVAVVIGLVVIAAPAERAMGSVRAALSYVVPGALAHLIGFLSVSWTEALGVVWTAGSGTLSPLEPVACFAGLALAASSFAGPLWRRRIRILGLGGLALVLLYVGDSTDLVRTGAALIGMGFGALLARRATRGRLAGVSSQHEVRTLLAGTVIALAFSPLISLFSKAPHGPLHLLPRLIFAGESPIGEAACPVDIGIACEVVNRHLPSPSAVLLAVLPLVVLAVAGWGVLRGRRAGALIAAAVTALLALLELMYFTSRYFYGPAASSETFVFKGEETIGAIIAVAVPAAVSTALLLSLRQFPTRTGTVGRNWGLVILATLVGCSATFVVGGLLASHQFSPHVGLLELLTLLPSRFVPVGFLHWSLFDVSPKGPVAVALYSATGPVFWVVLVIATVALVRARSVGRSAATEARVREMLHRDGAGALSFMATWTGNSYWSAPDGAGIVATRHTGGVAIALGDPIGPPERRGEAIRAFIESSSAHGEVPAFYAIDDESAPVFTDLGWQLLIIGEEARIDAQTFTLEGGRWKDIRTSINRARRTGVEARWTAWSELSVSLRNQINRISEEWLAGKEIPEMGYTLGGIDELRDQDVRLMLAIDGTGRVSAITSWLPTYRDGRIRGWTLDFMRRSTTSANGEMEMLIAETVLRAQREGVEFVSLSAAPLSRIAPGSSGSEAAARLLEGVGSRLERLYHFKSLLNYKLKFAPELRPLYLAYPDSVSIPAIGIALVRAYLPGLTTRQLLAMTRELAGPKKAAAAKPAAKAPQADEKDKTPTPAG